MRSLLCPMNGARRGEDATRHHGPFGIIIIVERSRPGQLLHDPGHRQRRVDPVEQVALILGLRGHLEAGRRLVGVLDEVSDLRQQQAGRAVDGTAAAGERAVGEPAARVGEHDSLGAALDAQAGEPGQVLGHARLAQRLGDLRPDLRVVDDRVLDQRTCGALGRGLALRAALGADECGVQQPGGAGQVLNRAGGAEQRGAYVVVDVVECVAAFGVLRPGFQRPVRELESAAVDQPAEHVHDRGLMRANRRVKAKAVDGVRRRAEGADEVGEADLNPGSLETREYET